MKGKKFKLHNVGHLRTWLKTGGGYHGRRAIAQAAKFGEEAIPILIEGLLREGHWNEEGICRDALAKIGKPAVPALLEVLDGKAGAGRRYAIEALGKMREKSAVPIFARMLRDTNTLREMGIELNENMLWESECIVEALGEIKSEDAIVVLVKALEHSSGTIGNNANKALKEAGHAAIPGLIRGLKSENSETRRLISRRLKKLGKLAVWELKKVINNEEEDFLFRFRAIEALGPHERQYTIPILLGNLTNIDVCEEVCSLLETQVPRNTRDLQLIRKARAEFKGKYGNKPELGNDYRRGVSAMRQLYCTWGDVLGKNANYLVKTKGLPRPKILKQNGFQRVHRVQKVIR